MRLSEMTHEQLIKQIDDDAIAREVFDRLCLAQHRVTEEVQALEHRVATLSNKLASYENGTTCPNCQGWGCNKCCSSDAEIRARQGTFG